MKWCYAVGFLYIYKYIYFSFFQILETEGQTSQQGQRHWNPLAGALGRGCERASKQVVVGEGGWGQPANSQAPSTTRELQAVICIESGKSRDISSGNTSGLRGDHRGARIHCPSCTAVDASSTTYRGEERVQSVDRRRAWPIISSPPGLISSITCIIMLL